MGSRAAWPSFVKKFVVLLALAVMLVPAGAGQSLAAEKGALTLEQARAYMLSLINRDRALAGLGPLRLDATACDAAQAHSDDMARWGYISHWDLAGRKPDQRYSESGGTGAVFENVYTNHNNPYRGRASELVSDGLFPAGEIEKAESWFYNQLPGQDGHRRNILDPHHGAVGIGLSMARDGVFGQRITVAQEFVHDAGRITSLPAEAAPGSVARIAGRLARGVSLHAIQIKREDLPRPMDHAALKQTGAYHLPVSTLANLFPQPAPSPAPVSVARTDSGEDFSLTLKDAFSEGLYYIVVWAKAGDGQPFIASTRTVRVAGPALGPIAGGLPGLPGS